MAQNYGAVDSIDTKDNVQNLVNRITNNLQQIRQITKDLGDMCSIMGGPHDTPQKRSKMMQLQQKAKDLLMFTKSFFESISHMHIMDEASRLTVTRVKEEYDNIVPKYNEVHEKIIAKMSQMALEARQSISLLTMENDDPFTLKEQVTQDDTEIQDAEEMMKRVQQLEKNIVQAEALFTEINKIVDESREDVDKIEVNVINANDDVELGNEKLQQATVYKEKAMKKKICIVVTVLIVLAIIGVIIWASVKKK